LFIALYLHKFATFNELFQVFLRCGQERSGQLFEIPFVAFVDVRLFALGEAVDEKRPHAPAEQDDRTISAGLSFVRPGDPLLDDATTVIGVNPT
jgi:hypothetical protein